MASNEQSDKSGHKPCQPCHALSPLTEPITLSDNVFETCPFLARRALLLQGTEVANDLRNHSLLFNIQEDKLRTGEACCENPAWRIQPVVL